MCWLKSCGGLAIGALAVGVVAVPAAGQSVLSSIHNVNGFAQADGLENRLNVRDEQQLNLNLFDSSQSGEDFGYLTSQQIGASASPSDLTSSLIDGQMVLGGNAEGTRTEFSLHFEAMALGPGFGSNASVRLNHELRHDVIVGSGESEQAFLVEARVMIRYTAPALFASQSRFELVVEGFGDEPFFLEFGQEDLELDLVLRGSFAELESQDFLSLRLRSDVELFANSGDPEGSIFGGLEFVSEIVVVPSPGVFGAIGFGGLFASGRRRRA